MKLLVVTQAVDANHQNLGFFVRWLEEFSKHCESVTVIANEVGDYSLPKNVTVYGLGKEYGSARIKRYVKFLALIVWFTREYDAVFCHMNPEFVLAGGWWWRLTGKKLGLWYVHGTVSERLRAAIALVHIAFTTNKESLRVDSPKVQIVGHGIDTNFFKPAYRLGHDEKLAVVAGRMSPSKRAILIRDAIILAGSRTSLRGTFIGGPMTQEDRAYETEFLRGVYDKTNVRYVGPKPQTFVRDAVATADIFVNVSLTASLDKAVLEAMAAGTVPVTTNPSFRAMLEPLGLWLSSDTTEALADKLVEVATRTDFEALRDEVRALVVRDHSLTTLVPKLIAGLSENTSLPSS